MNLYDVGDVVRLSVSFTNSAGSLVDPSSVAVQYRRWLASPSSFQTLTYGVNSVTRATTGVYYTDVEPAEEGEWHYRWNGTGNNKAAVEGRFKIRMRGVG